MVPTVRISENSKRYETWMKMFGTDCVPVTSPNTLMTHIKGGPAAKHDSEVCASDSELGACFKVDILALPLDNRATLLAAVAAFLGKPESEITSVVWGLSGVDIVDGPDLTMHYESQFAV